MIKNYNTHTFFNPLKRNAQLHYLFLAVLFFTSAHRTYSQTYTFTPCGATGQFGPTQAMANTAYASTSLNGSVTITGTTGIQSFIAPYTGNYRIEADGAQGGNSPINAGGSGARMIGDFALNAGDVIKIVVGQAGIVGVAVVNGDAEQTGGTGGGGSFVMTSSGVALLVAGGGGGASQVGTAGGFNAIGGGGTITTAGSPGGGAATSGGTGGGGGVTYNWTGWHGGTGGGGVSGNGVGNSAGAVGFGTANTPGLAYVNGAIGGTGGSLGRNGGFGGGGSAGFTGGGGGGYSGGGAGTTGGTAVGGGGGGSYNNGVNQNNTSAVNTGDGKVIITPLCNISLSSTSTSLCSGGSATLTTNAVSNYSWSTGNTTSSVIVVSPGVTTTYTVGGTSTQSCYAGTAITITVNAGIPTVAITSSTPSTCYGNTVSISATGALTYTFSNSISNGVAFVPTQGVNVYTVTGANGCGTNLSTITVTVSALPVAAVASSTLICAGKPATLTASGANSFTWSAGNSTLTSVVVSPNSTAVYTLSGTSGACSNTATITITTKPNPTLSIAASSTAVCNGDMVNLSVTGNAVTYTWSPGGTPGTSISDTPGSTTLYSVNATNSVGCTSSAQQVVIVNPLPLVNATVSNLLVCSGGASTLSASGASTYVWTGGSGASSATMVVNPLVDETYTVMGTSSLSCSASTVVTVSIYSPTISITSATTICSGATAILNAGVADSYSWSNGQSNQNTSVTPTLTTVYTLTASVNNLNGLSCPTTNSVQVTVNELPVITATSNRTAMCVGETVTLTAAGAGATGTYTFTGGAGAVISATSAVSPIADQSYTISGTDANGCKGKGTYNLVVAQCVGIAVNSANTANLSVYPNPSAGEFTISSDQAITLLITNELGQHVKTIVLNKNTTDVKVNNLSNGIYFISGKNENGSVKQKIVIAK